MKSILSEAGHYGCKRTPASGHPAGPGNPREFWTNQDRVELGPPYNMKIEQPNNPRDAPISIAPPGGILLGGEDPRGGGGIIQVTCIQITQILQIAN